GAHTVPQFAIIFDDVIGDTKFMNEKAFTRCFYQVRHVNCTTFICTQHFKKVPKICRLQANFVFFFQGSKTEVDIVAEDFAPP
ncbi:ATPase/DNA packaging protein, partial [Klebsiella pneumoniae]|uniref:ATPase/DNA packaging protein n=1 Tax=Klebsiella pneumoniae TaxID=573 RepID=UPI0025A11DDC